MLASLTTLALALSTPAIVRRASWDDAWPAAELLRAEFGGLALARLQQLQVPSFSANVFFRVAQDSPEIGVATSGDKMVGVAQLLLVRPERVNVDLLQWRGRAWMLITVIPSAESQLRLGAFGTSGNSLPVHLGDGGLQIVLLNPRRHRRSAQVSECSVQRAGGRRNVPRARQQRG